MDTGFERYGAEDSIDSISEPGVTATGLLEPGGTWTLSICIITRQPDLGPLKLGKALREPGVPAGGN